MELDCGWRHAQKKWAENLEDFLKIQLSSDHGVEKLRPDHGVEKLGSDHGVEDLGLDHAGRQLSSLPLGQRIEFSAIELSFFTIEAAVKLFVSQPAKMNWDLKHHEMCRMLGVLLA